MEYRSVLNTIAMTDKGRYGSVCSGLKLGLLFSKTQKLKQNMFEIQDFSFLISSFIATNLWD